MAKENMTEAKRNKNDEFYTQYQDIQKEINAYIEYNPNVFKDKVILLPCDDPEWSNFTKFFAQNFENFGIKKLISTSFALESKSIKKGQLSLFELNSPQYDETKTNIKGKIFTLCKDTNKDKRINIDDLEWDYLESDGDFRSEEVKKLRDEADIIITNPPFSLFREFLNWIIEADKKFLIISHQNSLSYRDIFPLIKDNKIWLGKGFNGGASHFINKHYDDYATANNHLEGMIRVSGVIWLTNLEHGKRHQILRLMTFEDNLKYNKKLKKKLEEYGSEIYLKYDNYDAIEVPFTDAIPSDYEGIMGVPITFLDKYNPDQFEIIGLGNSKENFIPNKKYTNAKKHLKNGEIQNGNAINSVLTIKIKYQPTEIYYSDIDNDYLIAPYARVLIRKK